MSSSESEYLADLFATVARDLESATDPAETEHLVTRRAVDMVPGCAYAGITLIHQGGRVSTVAATDKVADRIHVIQNELGEGPCLSTIADHVLYTIDDLRHDERWPRFAARVAAELPVASMLSFRLFTGENTIGVLNLYADQPYAFDSRSRAIGMVLAAHAAIAMSAAREQDKADNLDAALQNSRQIGMAIGIVMHSHDLDQHQAFDFLTDISQRLNRKLRDVAEAVVEGGGIRGVDSAVAD